MNLSRTRADEIKVRQNEIGCTRRTDGHRLARRLRLDCDLSVCTRKSALRSCGERQRIRLYIDGAACRLDLAVCSKINRRGFERCRRRPSRLDFGIRIEYKRAARLELHRTGCIRYAVRAYREAARHIDLRTAARRHETRIFTDFEICAVFERKPLCRAIEFAEGVCAREGYCRIRRIKHKRICCENARARNGILRGERQRMARSDIHRTADGQCACPRINGKAAVRRYAVCRDIRLLTRVADDILFEVPNLARA